MPSLEQEITLKTLTPPLEHSQITLRDTRAQDFDSYLRWREPGAEWKEWDAPWEKSGPLLEGERKNWVRKARARNSQEPRTHLEIETHGGVHIGFVSAYWTEDWTDSAQDWLSIGLVICESAYWSRGYGRAALECWTDYLFLRADCERVGISTWSGNERMARLSMAMGFVEEGRFRGARAVKGVRFDALRFGLLKEEWAAQAWSRVALS